MNNQFITAMSNGQAFTQNGAASKATSGATNLDYFGNAGTYRGRTYEEVSADMSRIFSEDRETALRIVFYNRMITRKVDVGGEKIAQTGQGQRDEFAKSLQWLERNYPELLFQNLWLIPVVGSWKDLWYDSRGMKFYNYINPQKVYELVEGGMQFEQSRGLIAKFLPKIRSKSNVKTDRHKRMNQWARGLCTHLGWTEKDYRKFKSDPSNTAHQFQRVMCAEEWKKLDFNTIPGKALFNMLNKTGKDGKNVLERQKLEAEYLKWIEGQPVAKFTGYAYELYKAAKESKLTLIQKVTLDKQFEGLLELARTMVPKELLEGGVLCALDTSGSMGWSGGTNVQPIDVCVGLGIYFSNLIEGWFNKTVVMFDNKSRTQKLSGTFCEQASQVPSNAMGGTNFQSVIDEIVRVRQTNPQIPIDEYPKTLLVVSDMQFNPSGSGGYSFYQQRANVTSASTATNYEAAMQKLRAVGLADMTIIWWNVKGSNSGEVPSTIEDAGTVLISGMDGAALTLILGGEQTTVDKKTGTVRKLNPLEQMHKVLDQPTLNALTA